MVATEDTDLAQMRRTLAELDGLSRAEYGIGIEELLVDGGPEAPLRVQRLAGIVLKAPFAAPVPSSGNSLTGARRSWPWTESSPEESAARAPRELALLNRLRMPGAWNERKGPSGTPADDEPVSWEDFQDDVEHERGLFKVVALYLDDVLKGAGRRTLREYVEAPESRRFEAGLDLAALLMDAKVVGPLLAVLGVPGLAVGVALVGIQYGYRRMTDPDRDRVGDEQA